MKKTLYVSDLDGTLLGSNERTSAFTNETINKLAAQGMLFSYATARSYHTAHRVTAGLNAKIPLIVYNGAMVVDNVDGTILQRTLFPDGGHDLLDDLIAHGVYPLVYALIDGEEKFSYLPDRCTPGMRAFLATRSGDRRARPVESVDALHVGELFYLTCIGEAASLEPLYEKYRTQHHCVFQEDLYTKVPWLELMPQEATKAHAIVRLRQQLDCDRLVVFGDGKNDLEMFALAEEAYAVSNAVDELKACATGVIESNDEDGVARWLLAHVPG